MHTTGEVYFDFSLGNRLYTAKFIVIELHSKIAGILGYNFMKSNNIIIHCGKTITNNPQFSPKNGSTNKADINYLRVRPSRNYEIEQNSIRSIKLKTFNYPIAMLTHFLFTPFYIFKEDGQPQLATLNQKGEFEYSLEIKLVSCSSYSWFEFIIRR